MDFISNYHMEKSNFYKTNEIFYSERINLSQNSEEDLNRYSGLSM